MMDKQNIFNSIRQNTGSEFDKLSDSDLESLLKATIQVIDTTLENGDSVDIKEFGTFSRRKCATFFRASDKLNDSINKK